jgi:hypothetical protein
MKNECIFSRRPVLNLDALTAPNFCIPNSCIPRRAFGYLDSADHPLSPTVIVELLVTMRNRQGFLDLIPSPNTTVEMERSYSRSVTVMIHGHADPSVLS